MVAWNESALRPLEFCVVGWVHVTYLKQKSAHLLFAFRRHYSVVTTMLLISCKNKLLSLSVPVTRDASGILMYDTYFYSGKGLYAFIK